MIELNRKHLIGAVVVILVGGIVIHHLGHHSKPTHHHHVTTTTGTLIAPPATTTTTTTTQNLAPWTQNWNVAGSNTVEHHFHATYLGWLWVVPNGAPNSYLWVNPAVVNNSIQYGVETNNQWQFGSAQWPTTGNPSPALQTQNPLIDAVSLMEPLIGTSGQTISPSGAVVNAYRGSSIGLQLYQAQTVQQYQLQGVVAQPGIAGAVDITFVVQSALPPNLLGPVYYDPQGQVVQDLTFQFSWQAGRWAWTGYSENPIATTEVANQQATPPGPIL